MGDNFKPHEPYEPNNLLMSLFDKRMSTLEETVSMLAKQNVEIANLFKKVSDSVESVARIEVQITHAIETTKDGRDSVLRCHERIDENAKLMREFNESISSGIHKSNVELMAYIDSKIASTYSESRAESKRLTEEISRINIELSSARGGIKIAAYIMPIVLSGFIGLASYLANYRIGQVEFSISRIQPLESRIQHIEDLSKAGK